MQAGRLYHSATLYRRKTIKDSFGAQKTTFVKAQTLRLYINRQSGAEGLIEHEFAHHETLLAYMHLYLSKVIDLECRIEVNGVMYDISNIYVSVQPRRTEVTLTKVNG